MADKMVERQIMETANAAEVIPIKQPVPPEKPANAVIKNVPAVAESPKKPVTSKFEVIKLASKEPKLAAVETVAPIESLPRDTPRLKVVEAAAQKPVAAKRSAGRPAPELRLVQPKAAILDTVSDLIAEATLPVKTETTTSAVVDDEIKSVVSETDTTTPTTGSTGDFDIGVVEVDQSEPTKLGDFLADIGLTIDKPTAEYSQTNGEYWLVDSPETPPNPAEQIIDFLSEKIATMEPEAAEQATEKLVIISELVALAAETEPETAKYTELVEQMEVVCAELLTQLGIEYKPNQLKLLVTRLLGEQQALAETNLQNTEPTAEQFEILTDNVFAQRLMQRQRDDYSWRKWLDHARIGRVAIAA